ALNVTHTAEKIMTSPVITVTPDTPLRTIIDIMDKKGISQIPVVNEGRVVGTVFESSILKTIGLRKDITQLRARDVMEDPLPMVPPSANINIIKTLLLVSPAVLVVDKDGVRGIITKIDLIKYLTIRP
ncbi:MAG TPA: CBS domain-containing protein, partial [Acidilobales archaeon]|nr:CBS domain-containing protein [Acidilobales archaeon]